MDEKNQYEHLPAELAETLRRMDEAYKKVCQGFPSLENDWEFALLEMRYEVIEQVARALEEEGLSQSDLARTMGVSRSYIGKIMNEKVNLKMETIAKLAVALKRDIVVRPILKSEKVVVESARKSVKRANRKAT